MVDVSISNKFSLNMLAWMKMKYKEIKKRRHVLFD